MWRRNPFSDHGEESLGASKIEDEQDSQSEVVEKQPYAPPPASTPGYGSTVQPSSRASIAPSMRSVSFVDDMRHEAMCNYIYHQQCNRLWVTDRAGECEGVFIRKRRGVYQSCPPQLVYKPLGQAVLDMNLICAVTVNSRVIQTFLSWSPDAMDVPLMNGLRIQILAEIEDLPRARKHQFAAFVASLGILVVWDDDPTRVMERAKRLEAELMDLVWRAGEGEDDTQLETKEVYAVEISEVDPELGVPVASPRPTNLQNSVLVAFTLVIVIVMLGAGFREVAIEVSVDKNYLRLAFVALVPVQIFFTLFFAQVIVGCLAQCFGPVQQLATNSRYYSAIKTPRISGKELPHITIQCPVYKEGLETVIAPTIRSIKQAISTYELQGGSANMFINDDGLQIVPEEERMARIDFYADNSIGWTARPKHDPKGSGFVRKGKFKKASNMNFGLMLSCNVEEKLSLYERPASWTQAEEAAAYSDSLQAVLQERSDAWADGNIRIGDYVLLIDSDTRVPSDCLLDAVSEMEASPEVGILQFSSGVMNVTGSFFESGITFFTNMVYTAIRYTVANGDVAPFVGHNAVLRWAAIQQVSYQDEDGYDKFWSESHVSEDFDMSLRLQCLGFVIRLSAWANDGFKEGVSLTVYDELARWEKYAYGCNELLFHPLRFWVVRGPFTKLFREFLFSNIRLTSKITIVSYIGTYYAIGAAWIMTTANYFAIGFYNGSLDKYYIDSWRVWFSIVIVFNGLGNIALAVLRYRCNATPFLPSLWENFKWVPMLAVFLGGLSLHVSQALLCHMFEIDIQWGATAKEVEFSNFFLEVPKVFARFRWSIIFAAAMIVCMVVLATAPFVPFSWTINDFTAILPMATVCASHLLLPIVLNPALMTFSW